MAEKINEKEMWVEWTHDAASVYEKAEDVESIDAGIDEMADFTSGYADEMLERYEERFTEDRGRPSRRKRRKDEDE